MKSERERWKEWMAKNEINERNRRKEERNYGRKKDGTKQGKAIYSRVIYL